MLPLVLAGAIWTYNIAKMIQLSNQRRNGVQRRDSDDTQKNLTIYHNCIFEDKRTFNFNHYDHCTFNTYNIYITGGKDEEHIKGKRSRDFAWLPEMDE